MLLILIQIIQVIFNCNVSFNKKKSGMFFNILIVNILTIVIFLIKGVDSSFYLSITIAIRSFLVMFKDKYKYSDLVFIFCLLMHILTFEITFKDIMDIVVIVPTVITLVVLWYGSENIIRYGLLFSNFIWVIYYFYFGIYISGLFNLLVVISCICSIIKYNYRGYKVIRKSYV